MKHSDTITKIAPAFLMAQKTIKKATKGTENTYFKSKYADLTSVIEAVKGPLNDNEIAFMQFINGGYDGSTPGIRVETVLLHSSGEWLSEDFFMPIEKQTAQAVGSAISYAKRYGLQSICGLPTEDDDAESAMDRNNSEYLKAPKLKEEYSKAPHALPKEPVTKRVALETVKILGNIDKATKQIKSYQLTFDGVTIFTEDESLAQLAKDGKSNKSDANITYSIKNGLFYLEDIRLLDNSLV